MIIPSLLLILQDASLRTLPASEDLAEFSGLEITRMADEWELGDSQLWRERLQESLGDSARLNLFAARLLARSGSAIAASELIDLLRSTSPETDHGLQEAALATVGLPVFALNEEAQKALARILSGDGELSPSTAANPAHGYEFLAEVAVTLHQIGDGPHRRTALRRLRTMSATESREGREAGALALAQTGSVLSAQATEILETIAAEPGVRGRLASSLLEQQEQQMRYRAKLRALEDLYQSEGEAEGLEVLEEVLASVSLRHMEGDRFTQEELVSAAADGLLRRLDPYSNFLTAEEVKEFMFDIHPEYGGIGAYVNTVDGFFTIVRPIYSGPAFEVGLRTGDRILSVEGWSTIEQSNDEIIRRLKGPPGTDVTAEIFRKGWSAPREIQIPRRKIALPILQQEMLPGGVLYLELVSFSEDCGARIQRAISEAQATGRLEGVVLDLRNNPGGLLHEAVQVCDVFLKKGETVVVTRSRDEGEEVHKTVAPPAVDKNLPMVILVNRHSASASEIVSGALSIHGRAITVGERTHGKGSVQNLVRLKGVRDERWADENRNGMWDEWERYEDRNNNGVYDFAPRVKLTIAYYFLPDGSSIHTQRDHEGKVIEDGGVEPNVAVNVPSFPPATLRELDRLVGADVFRDYASGILASDPDLAVELAEYDALDEALYPGFEEFFSGLETILLPKDVRSWIRLRLRESVADSRGRGFPGNGFQGDYQEDTQLAEAIRQVLRLAGRDVAMVKEYAVALPARPDSSKEG